MPRSLWSDSRVTHVQQGHSHTEDSAMGMQIHTVRTLEHKNDLRNATCLPEGEHLFGCWKAIAGSFLAIIAWQTDPSSSAAC